MSLAGSFVVFFRGNLGDLKLDVLFDEFLHYIHQKRKYVLIGFSKKLCVNTNRYKIIISTRSKDVNYVYLQFISFLNNKNYLDADKVMFVSLS